MDSNSTAVVQGEVFFKGMSQRLLNYSQKFEEDYSMYVVDNLGKDIVDKMMSSKVLAASFRATYVCYIRVGKIIISDDRVIHLLVTLSTDVQAKQALNVTHLVNSVLYIYTEKNIILRIQAGNPFFMRLRNHASFQNNIFHRDMSALCDEIQAFQPR